MHRLIIDFDKNTLSWKPKRIVYHSGSSCICYDLEDVENLTVFAVDHLEAQLLVRKPFILYFIDGQTIPMASSCITIFISYSSSEYYTRFIKHNSPRKWYFPTWTIDELKICREYCYPTLGLETVSERHRIYGGVARFVFHPDYSVTIPKSIEDVLADADAVKDIGNPLKMLTASHSLLHIIVSSDGLYNFLYIDIASKYVGEQLWIHHSAQMILNLQALFRGISYEISRHLLEIYGHMVFSAGGRKLRCRCLESGAVTEIQLDTLGSNRITFGADTIPTAETLIGKYFETTDDGSFPAVDSLSPQGMFQFTVAAEHPIRGVQILRRLCALYGEPKLYFIAKTGTHDVNEIDQLKQYVLELPVT